MNQSGTPHQGHTPRFAPPFYCPYCGDEDLRPAESHGQWLCGGCLRAFSLKFEGITFPPAAAGSDTGASDTGASDTGASDTLGTSTGGVSTGHATYFRGASEDARQHDAVGRHESTKNVQESDGGTGTAESVGAQHREAVG
jgi:hypothetical protein